MLQVQHTFMKRLCPWIQCLNSRYQKGVATRLPRRQSVPNFHAFSRSRVRAYTLVMRMMIYSDDST
jgi:hypothetical protein